RIEQWVLGQIQRTALSRQVVELPALHRLPNHVLDHVGACYQNNMDSLDKTFMSIHVWVVQRTAYGVPRLSAPVHPARCTLYDSDLLPYRMAVRCFSKS